ncbi:MAG: histidine kinase [Methyloprofundus sp.]|nr:histidine kinase [Methyloprofundus sp.]
MSLRYQINLRIFISTLCILLLAGVIGIWQARAAVDKEVDSSINLAVQLIKLGFTDGTPISAYQLELLPRLKALNATRHLKIQLKLPSGELIKLEDSQQKIAQADLPPAWFVSLVNHQYAATEYPLITTHGAVATLIIQAYPLDEITEVWQESLTFFLTLLIFTLLTFIAVNLVFNKSLQAIEQIIAGLTTIESGQYQFKLPIFATREYDRIAYAINHLATELNNAQIENSELTKHALEIQEEERQRLSQELHDEFGQSITAIKVMAATAAHPKSDTVQITASISDICDHLMEVVRNLMYQLHPLVLTELGLKAALDDMLNHWGDINPQLKISLQCSEQVDSLPPAMAIQVFRVIQESLTNAVRHADAQHINITLAFKESEDAMLQILIQDDGSGCDMQTIKSGFGLRGMQTRITTLGGELDITALPGKGMTITANIPLK